MSKAAKEREIKQETRELLSQLRTGSGNPNYKIVEREKLIKIIKKNHKINLEDIGRELEISKNTAMVKIRELLYMSFQEAKNEYYFKKVAIKMDLPETAFLYQKDDVYQLRWFTRNGTEVDLCGHATLAAAYILWDKDTSL